MNLKSFKPDTPKEWAFIAAAVARVCDAVGATVIITGNPYYALATIGVGAAFREIAAYFKLEEDEQDRGEATSESEGITPHQ